GSQPRQAIPCSLDGQRRSANFFPFSRIKILLVALVSSMAAKIPAGPPPTMTTSYLFIVSPPHFLRVFRPLAFFSWLTYFTPVHTLSNRFRIFRSHNKLY